MFDKKAGFFLWALIENLNFHNYLKCELMGWINLSPSGFSLSFLSLLLKLHLSGSHFIPLNPEKNLDNVRFQYWKPKIILGNKLPPDLLCFFLKDKKVAQNILSLHFYMKKYTFCSRKNIKGQFFWLFQKFPIWNGVFHDKNHSCHWAECMMLFENCDLKKVILCDF